MTLIADFHRFKSDGNKNVWIKEKNIGFWLLRRERVGPLMIIDSCYYYLFSNYALNYKWMEEYEKPLGPALEISKTLYDKIVESRNLMVSVFVVNLFNKKTNNVNILYKSVSSAFMYMDKHRLWFGEPMKGFLPLSEFTSKDPLDY